MDVLGDGGGEVTRSGGSAVIGVLLVRWFSYRTSLFDESRTRHSHIAQPAAAEIELAAVLHALSDPVRLRIVAALAATRRAALVRGFDLP